MDKNIFIGKFRLSIYNSHEMYDRIHTLTLSNNKSSFKGTLHEQSEYGTQIWDESECEVEGEYNAENYELKLKLKLSSGRNATLILKHNGTKIIGNFISFGDRWDTWQKLSD